MEKLLESGLRQLGINEPIQRVHAVSGGDINEAFYVLTLVGRENVTELPEPLFGAYEIIHPK